MRTQVRRLVIVLAAGLPLVTRCPALTPVDENFKGDTLNTQRWKLAEFGNARLRQFDEHLNLTVGPNRQPHEGYAYVQLRNNQPGYNESWLVRLDVENTAQHGKDVGIGLWIYNADDPSDAMFFDFFGNPTREFRTMVRERFLNDGTKIAPDLNYTMKRVPSGKLAITFNHQTKLFTLYFGRLSNWPSEGDIWWQELDTFSPTGKGGDVRANWHMNPGSGRFGIRLQGFSNGEVVKPGEAHIRTFTLKDYR